MLTQAQGEVNLSMDFPEDDPGSTTWSSSPWPPACGAATRRRWSTTPSRTPWWRCSSSSAGPTSISTRTSPGHWPRTRPRSPAWPTCSTICWSACAFPPYCSPPLCPRPAEDLRPARRGRRRAHLGVRRSVGPAPPAGAAVSKGENLFPRIDVEKELAALDELQAEARRAALPAVEVEPFAQESVDFDTFCKSDFRAVKVKACESVKKERQAPQVHPGRRFRD